MPNVSDRGLIAIELGAVRVTVFRNSGGVSAGAGGSDDQDGGGDVVGERSARPELEAS